jgi:hypothetical protein
MQGQLIAESASQSPEDDELAEVLEIVKQVSSAFEHVDLAQAL